MREPVREKYEESTLEMLAMKAKEGDREARNTLYFRLEEVIAGSTFGARQLLDRFEGAGGFIDEDDISQEAFAIFCRLLNKWDPELKPLVPYIVTMMHACTVSYVRDRLHLRSKRMRLAPLNQQRQAEMPSRQPGPEEFAEESAQWEALVAQLSGDWRRFVSMKFYEDLSSRQIAQANHCSDRTINRALHSALELLRYNTQEEWEAV